MFELLNVFESFLPQLLLYPNPTDPLNGEAAALLMREPAQYAAKVKGASRSAVPRRYRAPRALAAPPHPPLTRPGERSSRSPPPPPRAEYVLRYAQEALLEAPGKAPTTDDMDDDDDSLSYISDGSDSL